MIKDIINYEGPIDALFLVKQCTKATSNNGTSYLSLVLQDTSGVLDCKMWQITDADCEIAKPGSIIRAIGIMGTYKGHPQLKINEIEPVDEKEVSLSRFLPVAPRPIEEMEREIDEKILSIKDDELRLLTKTVIEKRKESYLHYPAAVTVHHAYIGGLAFHSLSVLALCEEAAKEYPFLDRDLLVSGALLHDIGKTEELSGATISTYTVKGNLLGHITLGALIVEEEGKKLSISGEKLTLLVHMILSHHGELEFGSPKVPMTAESVVLHHMDDVDAKLNCLKNYLDLTEDESFTTKIPWMSGAMFYKHD